MTATDLYGAMDAAIDKRCHRRTASGCSPQQSITEEAAPGCQFTMEQVYSNVPMQRALNVPWAIANVLHFFSGTEAAGSLLRYNKHAHRFLDGARWKGAYGAIAMPQLRRCVDEMRKDPDSRREFVSMGDAVMRDMNRPACWNVLHFLQSNSVVDMLVYQRSLNLPGVMPYDCILLTHVLRWFAALTGFTAGSIIWTVGSLHRLASAGIPAPELTYTQLNLPLEVIDDASECWQWLNVPQSASPYWAERLLSCG